MENLLYTPASPRPPLDELAAKPLLRKWTMLQSVWRAGDNLLEMFHPEAQGRPYVLDDLGGARLLTVNDADLARHVLSDNAANYEKGHLYKALLGDFLGESASLLLNGEPARRRRRLLAPAFNARAMRRLEAVIARHVAETVARWEAAADAGEPITLTREAPMFAMHVAMDAFFSASLGERAEPMAALLDAVMTAAGTPSMADVMALPGWVPRRSRSKLRRMVAELDEVLYEVIDARLALRDDGPPDTPDTLDLLVHARDADTGEHLSRREIRNEVVTLFMAGHETTALSLAWGVDRLAREPEAQARLAEAALIAATETGPATADSLKAAPLIGHAFDEMLRTTPPVFVVARTALGPDHWEELEIRAGDRVQIAIFMLHRNARYWDDPGAFRPERFAEGGRHPFAFLPFGAGPRLCIGLAVAKLEAHLLLAEALRRLRFEPVGDPPSPLGKITLRTVEPVRVRPVRRAPA